LKDSQSPIFSLRRFIRLTAGFIIAAYGLTLIAILLLKLTVGERWVVVALVNSVLHLALVPSLVFLPMCLLWRRWRLGLLILPSALAFILAFGVFFLPLSVRTANPASSMSQLTLLTYNLASRDQNLEEAIIIIREANADIVNLQELSEGAAVRFSADFASEYPYQALHPQTGEPIPGQGILSRYPITADEYWRIHLGHQRVQIDMNSTTITVYNPHPIQPLVRDGFALRTEEITDLLARAEGDAGPLILAGDFNMTDQSEDYGRVASRYTDAYREAGWGLGLTFPANAPYFQTIPFQIPGPPWPLVRIDYIFHNSFFQALEAQVWPTSGGSDHRPLFARLALVSE
jgi:vancomycin resistance protein VanJ